MSSHAGLQELQATESEDHFERRVTEIAKKQLDCIVRGIEKVELMETVLQSEQCPEEFFTMRMTAERQPKDVIRGFYVWAQDDRN